MNSSAGSVVKDSALLKTTEKVFDRADLFDGDIRCLNISISSSVNIELSSVEGELPRLDTKSCSEYCERRLKRLFSLQNDR